MANGTKLFRFPKDVMEAWRSRNRWRCTAELSGQQPGLEEDLRGLQHASAATQNLWFRFTEAGFDDFMQAQKL